MRYMVNDMMAITHIINILQKLTNMNVRTGPFEGFFVSSVEFCKFKFDDRKI